MPLSNSNAGEQLKAISVVVLGGIAAMCLFPYASGDTYRIEESQVYITLASAAAIVLVMMSDRITLLKLTTDSLEIQLSSIKEELNDTIQEVKENIPGHNNKIEKAQSLVSDASNNKDHDLLEEANDIGQAMKLLREVMREYKRASSSINVDHN
ncbi:MAG: hypothetical protein AB2820_12635 [Candidatus Thiodiazotropha sp.]